MRSEFGVALMTRKPFTAALEFDGDDVAFAVVMSTPRLFINVHPDDRHIVDLHVSDLRCAPARA